MQSHCDIGHINAREEDCVAPHLPITLVASGYERASLHALEDLVRSHPGRAVVLQERAQRRRSPDWVVPTTPRTQQVGAACSCCTVRSDLATKVHRMVEGGDVDHVMLQVPPHGDLDLVTRTFTRAIPERPGLPEATRLQQLVTLVTVASLAEDLAGARGVSVASRIELADVVVLCGDGPADEAAVLVAALNPWAELLPAAQVSEVWEATEASHFDLQSARGRALLSPTDHGARFVFQARRPFHPARLHTWLQGDLGGAIRACGRFWVASHPHHMAVLEAAGSDRETGVGGLWWASVPAERRPRDPSFRAQLDAHWHPAFGDREQHLVFAGPDLQRRGIEESLQRCLLDDHELDDPSRWAHFPHPFSWPEAS